MEKILPLFLCVLLAGCGGDPAARRYSDQVTEYTEPTMIREVQRCDTRGNVTREGNHACVGRVIAAVPNGPTITVLQPGVAVPAAKIDAVVLAPPR